MKRLVLIVGLTIGWSLLNIIDHKNRWVDKFAIVRAQSCCTVDEPTCIANNGSWDPVTCCTYPDPDPTCDPSAENDCISQGGEWNPINCTCDTCEPTVYTWDEQVDDDPYCEYGRWCVITYFYNCYEVVDCSGQVIDGGCEPDGNGSMKICDDEPADECGSC